MYPVRQYYTKSYWVLLATPPKYRNVTKSYSVYDEVMKLGDLDTMEILDSTYYTYYDEFQKALSDGRNYRPPKLIHFLNQGYVCSH